MTDRTANQPSNLLRLSAGIVSAHVKHNAVAPSDLPELVRSVYVALQGLGQSAGQTPTIQEPQKPAVAVKKSVFPDYIISLEDGRKLKTLKRYLQTSYGLTPEEYRAKWGLPPDYPMVAPSYAESRSAHAKSIGLGRKIAGGPSKPVEEPAQHSSTRRAAKKAKRNTSEADTAAS